MGADPAVTRAPSAWQDQLQEQVSNNVSLETSSVLGLLGHQEEIAQLLGSILQTAGHGTME